MFYINLHVICDIIRFDPLINMEKALKIIATYTYPHEAAFMKSALANAGIQFFIRSHKPFIQNHYYSQCEKVKIIYINSSDTKAALQILHQIHPDLHMQNRCTKMHTEEMESSIESEPVEKGFCWVCYGLMVAGLSISVYAIIQSLLFIF